MFRIQRVYPDHSASLNGSDHTSDRVQSQLFFESVRKIATLDAIANSCRTALNPV